MSRPYFIRIPKEFIDPKFNIQFYHDVYPYPKRVETLCLDYWKWLEMENREDTPQNQFIFKTIMNANDVKKGIIDRLIFEKFNARQTFESGGGKGGYTMNLYIDQDKFDTCYFYTTNRYRKKKACQDFGGHKFFYINIYAIPYDLFKMVRNQNKYEFLFWQKPSGFVFNIDPAGGYHTWQTPLKQKKIDW